MRKIWLSCKHEPYFVRMALNSYHIFMVNRSGLCYSNKGIDKRRLRFDESCYIIITLRTILLYATKRGAEEHEGIETGKF